MRRFLSLCCLLLCACGPVRAQDSYAGRPEVREFIAEMVERHGFTARELSSMFAKVRSQPQILRAMARPAEAPRRSWQSYRAMFLSAGRIDAGAHFREANAGALQRAADRYGVPQELIVAIIGVETVYGSNMGGYRVIEALSTLAFDYPARAPFFRSELEQFLLHARETRTDALTVKGSYAGAIGIPQFMPGSYRRFAVDFDGDGRRDLHGSAADAIGSVANFLKAHGWQRGQPVAARARVSGEAHREMLAAGIRPAYPVGDLPHYGVTTDEPLPASLLAALVDLETPGAATEYWVGLQNFYALTRYNRSSFYAISVIELARAIAQASGRRATGATNPG